MAHTIFFGPKQQPKTSAECRWRRKGNEFKCGLPIDDASNLPRSRGTFLKPRSVAMAIQIVMDRNGDTRHNFDAEDLNAVSKAERRFNELTGAGFTAAIRTADRDPVVTRTFDPTAEETLFFPRLVGG